MIIFYIIKESFLYAINSLYINKLRTILSLLGITIGIFAIISVFTVIDSLENNIRSSIAKLGDNVVYVQKWPWSFGSDYPWWKYMNRPVPTLEEWEEINKRSQNAKAATFMAFLSRTVEYRDNYMSGVQIDIVTQDYENIRSFEIAKGRFFSSFESERGRNVAVLGNAIAEDLFQGENPIGKTVKIGGHKVQVVGVFSKEGEDMFGMSTDKTVIIPVNYARGIVNLKDENLGPMIMVKAKDNITSEELIDELRGIMRALRRQKPAEEDDFALNQPSVISQGFSSLFAVIDVAGGIIGGFSILVGAFGIANIMFVSVKEQTKIIGIQKALGAKRFFILLQFLYEAVILSLFGGVLGLFLIFILTLIVSSTGMEISMSAWNVSLGLIISISVGIISGFIPAYTASKLDPVIAINTN